jgi:ABC-type transporter Mla MlaB component
MQIGRDATPTAISFTAIMLRISATTFADNSTTLRLEGHLAGAWIAELRETCDRMLSAGRKVTLDLGDVSLIERSGLDLLASLSRRSVALVRCSPFQEEQLRQAAGSSSKTTTDHEPA